MFKEGKEKFRSDTHCSLIKDYITHRVSVSGSFASAVHPIHKQVKDRYPLITASSSTANALFSVSISRPLGLLAAWYSQYASAIKKLLVSFFPQANPSCQGAWKHDDLPQSCTSFLVFSTLYPTYPAALFVSHEVDIAGDRMLVWKCTSTRQSA